jgi:hypothetical protein
MGRFRAAGDELVPYSDLKPERCETPAGPAFLMPGETEPRECGKDPDMPPATARPYYERDVGLGFARLKGRL